jgi:predicted DCC family thiol-disulfide oxidoreductase YuxK
VLIYDGNCGFCRRWVARARRLDWHDRVRFLPMQDREAGRVSGRSSHALAQAVHLVRPDGKVFAGAAAVREYFRFVPGGFLVRLGFAIPGATAFAEWVYAWIARTWGPVR